MGNQELLKDTISCIEACSFIKKPNCEQCKMGGPGFGFGCREQVRIQALGLLKWHAKELERLQTAINDRGKVVSALENCVAKPKCRDCHWDECGSMTELIEIPSGLAHAALDLLKEQEPRRPIKSPNYNYSHYGYNCSKCGHTLHVGEYRPNYCEECGQAVKWDG